MLSIAIRADGGSSVGMGHIMRCLAIAQELKQLGCRVYFISRNKQGIDKVVTMGFEAYRLDMETIGEASNLGFDYGSAEELNEDLYKTRLVIEGHGCDLLIVDKYNLTTDYFKRLKEFVGRVAFVDDLNIFECSADIIINGNFNAPTLKYKEVFKGQKLLLGTNFTPLRKEFSSIPKREIKAFSEFCPEIMITTGGSDPYNCTGKLLEILLKDKRTADMRYNVVIGSGFKHKSEIDKIAEENSSIVLYINPKYMSEIICRSDLAISSGGSTLYELCCCGTPTVAFIMADNQEGIVNTLSDSGYIKGIGWYDQIKNINIADIIADMINDFSMRKMYMKRMQSLVDGKGALRIAQAIVEILQ